MVHRTNVIDVNFVERMTRRALLFAEFSKGKGVGLLLDYDPVDEAIRKYQAEYPEAYASVCNILGLNPCSF